MKPVIEQLYHLITQADDGVTYSEKKITITCLACAFVCIYLVLKVMDV